MNAYLLALTGNQWLWIGVGVVALIAILAALLRPLTTGVHGNPGIAPFTCSATSLSFTLDSGVGGDVPEKIYAVIFCGVSEPVNHIEAWKHNVSAGAHPSYSLTGVTRIGSGMGCVAKVWCCYTSPAECLPGTKACDVGSGSGFVDASKGGGGGGTAVPMFKLAPRHYMVSVGQLLQSDAAWLQELARDQPLKLAFQPDQSHGRSAVWRIEQGSAFSCELQVVKEGDGEPCAHLTIASKSNGSAKHAIQWSTDYWSFTGINRLVAARHTPESAYPQTVTVSHA